MLSTYGIHPAHDAAIAGNDLRRAIRALASESLEREPHRDVYPERHPMPAPVAAAAFVASVAVQVERMRQGGGWDA